MNAPSRSVFGYVFAASMLGSFCHRWEARDDS